MKTVELRVSGRVQGVGFRAFVRREADAEGVVGFVENCLDGSVHALLSGSADAVDRLIEAIRVGPPGADVDSCAVTGTTEVPDGERFVIRR